ncbi:MAG TPA: tetratricopeptide repeat protein [Pirellulales bacterium]|jgi:serine/threonine protein kinase|nr:tetratricopeptide repeat protein [Pirellulales bacterium]
MDKRSRSTPTATFGARKSGSADMLIERLTSDVQREMLAAWQAGANILAEQWLDRHPEVKAKPEIAVLVIYEELCLREERGEEVDSAELYRRFPQFREPLSVVLSCHRLMHADSAIFPAAGEEFGEFRLLRELGRGGAGRVFLATQPSLSDRPLVVKLTPRTGDEHLSLARLQHTHIVPLLLVQEFPERNLRAICMPFLGGASWSWILDAINSCPTQERSGARIVQALKAAEIELGLGASSGGPAIGFLAQASYEQAVCWVGSCLAEGLHHAHERGLLHLDIKPSNVLLAGDGQPMLLDFHLAHEVGPALRGHLDRVGGTAGYMSPEQQRAIQTLRADRSISIALDIPLPEVESATCERQSIAPDNALPSGPQTENIHLDARSDIYSLGVLLYESLAGRSPPADEKESRATLRVANPLVGRGLEDLLHKCLAQDRESRYANAGELATDLRRHVANLPLRGVGNRDLKERWQKWRRRKPHSLSIWTVSLTALAVISGVSAFFYTDRVQTARSALRQAELELVDGNDSSALERLTTGLQAIRWLPAQQDLKQRLQSQLVLAQRARVIGALHRLVEQLRFLDNVADVPPARLRELEDGCRAIWEARIQIAASNFSLSQQRESSEEIDLLDLALLWTRLGTQNPNAANFQTNRSKALTVIDQAVAQWGPSPALELARARLNGATNSGDGFFAQLSTTMPRAAWEHDAVGRMLLQTGKLEQAREIFEQAIELDPGAFWPHFHLALCAYRCQQFEEALRAADVCVALSPRRAECFFNRGLCLQALGQTDAALRDFSRANELDPSVGAASLSK